MPSLHRESTDSLICFERFSLIIGTILALLVSGNFQSKQLATIDLTLPNCLRRELV